MAVIGAIISAGVALYSASSAQSTAGAISSDQVAVANRAEDRLTKAADEALAWSKNLHDRYNQLYVPCEDTWLQKACGAAPYVPKYDSVINRTQASVRASFAQARSQIRDRQSVYCVGVTCAQERTLSIAEAAAMADAQNAAIRIEDARKDAFEERDYARLANAVNVGRLFAADARASSDTSARLWGQIAQAAGQSLAGSLQAKGAAIRGVQNVLSGVANRFKLPGQGLKSDDPLLAAVAEANGTAGTSGNAYDLLPDDQKQQQAVQQSNANDEPIYDFSGGSF